LKNNKLIIFITILVVFFIIGCAMLKMDMDNLKINEYIDLDYYSTGALNIIVSSENKDLEEIIKNYALTKDYDVNIEYAGTLEIMEKLNNGEQYDAVWAANSIWIYMLNDEVKISDSKYTSINPVVFGITKSKAEELGFINKTVYTEDIVNAIISGKLKFSMPNPTSTNSGASAYLGLLSTLAGNPEVLKKEDLTNVEIQEKLTKLFTGVERTSGSEEFLEEAFLKGNYEAVVTYESSIININKNLAKQGKETLYAIYPVDGVSISDSPLAYIDNGDNNKKEAFKDLQSYILSNEGQKKLQEKGRRTWYGGVSENVDKTIFNPEWGIDTTKYISPVKYPSTSVIELALNMYQSELRKPVHVVFCLDYSASMSGDGYNQLISAMDYILTEKARENYLQFSEKDKIDVIPFGRSVIDTWSTQNGIETENILNNIKSLTPVGTTALYPAAIEALNKLKNEDTDKYNVSVILMTDGLANVGNYNELEYAYRKINKEIPIYSIMFGNASEMQLEEIATLTNSKIFDGRTDLIKAFKEVRGYN